MRGIINLVVVLPCYLTHVHGLVIPRDDLSGSSIAPCDVPDACIDVAGIPAINDLNTSPPSDTKVDWNSDFVTEYTDASGQTHPLEFNPASLNQGLLSQLIGPNPLFINEPFMDQLRQSLPSPQTSEALSTGSFDQPDDTNILAQADTVSPPVDIPHDDFDIFNR